MTTCRIAAGGFQHETNSFAPRATRYADFLRPGGYPPLCAGADLIGTVSGSATSLAGFMGSASRRGFSIAPLAWCFASPAGPIEDEAFERIAALMCSQLASALDAGQLHGIFLDLHGAALAASFADAEGELLRRVRRIAGAIPICVTLDPHANLTRRMIDESDIIVPYRTYPHVDKTEVGALAADLLLQRIKRGAPYAKAFRQLDFLMPLSSQCTLMDPMAGVMAERVAIAGRHRLAELAFCFGFPYVDFPDCGAAVACYADDEKQAEAAVDALVAYIAARASSFSADAIPALEAVGEALESAKTGHPVIIADTQDNPGGGGHGDTTGVLSELIAQHAEGAVLCLINDPESAAACHAAGEGARVALSLGGKSDGQPIAVDARVVKLTDGAFVLTGPMARGNPGNLGPTALIEVDPGIRIIVVTRKMQAYDQEILRHVGIEPTQCRMIVLKSSVHFRADFAPIAKRIIIAAAPGPVIADPSMLPFRHLRKGLRLSPSQGEAATVGRTP